jgi:hypothetical protein
MVIFGLVRFRPKNDVFGQKMMFFDMVVKMMFLTVFGVFCYFYESNVFDVLG